MDLGGLDAVLRGSGFTGVVVVRHAGAVVFSAAYGYATPRWQIPNTVDTRFDTASITKLLTSVAVLQQGGAGRLDLDASIHRYVDLAGTTISDAVTLRHLLTHTSGIADDADEEAGEVYADLFVDTPCYAIMETVDFLSQFAHKPALAEPGVRARYCNVGYVLAGLALERVVGESYRTYVTREVFERAGMTGAGFFDRRDSVPEVAEGWDLVDGEWRANIFSYPPIGSPDGGAHASAQDLLIFLDAVRAGQLLTPELTKQFLTPQVTRDETVRYGFGLEFRRATLYKEGSNAGVSALLTRYSNTDVDAVVLSNTAGAAWPVMAELNRRFES
ncbi:serine hydrolase domain-containing protein [Microlunatus ginsengisoli]|uniref:Serine hydrolase domain-containing protein n=1 Tax=Microlunatus ginsengisoli TaxID=363863 RepID=A0ABP7ALV2_9ACTN